MIKLSERQEQEIVIDWISKAIPWFLDYTICIRNEIKCSKFVGRRLNAQGRLKGCADLFFAYPKLPFTGLFIEMKSLTGRLTKEQAEFLERMNHVGYYATKANGAIEAIEIIKAYLSDRL